MNKMNKKGFTLIEMLVVIAIIAVLVSIVIPAVGNSTNKAACATNAANLRSITAAVQVAYMQAETKPDSTALTVGDDAKITIDGVDIQCPGSVATTNPACDKGEVPTITVDASGNVTVTYGSLTIEDFAKEAGGGTKAAS